MRRTPARREPPAWNGTVGAVRVLVEHPDPIVSDLLGRGLVARGYDVRVCQGPSIDERGAVSCPLLQQRPCPAVSGADIVVSALPLSSDVNRMIVMRVADDDPDRPLLLEATPHMMARLPRGVEADGLYPFDLDRLSHRIDELVA